MMKIEINVQDYFNELKLMEKQYGQEEDLYPWIYMLLQKAKTNNEISIRTVADGRSAKYVLGRDQISAFGTFPDISILDKQFVSIDTEKGRIERKLLKQLIMLPDFDEKAKENIKKDLDNKRKQGKGIRIKVNDEYSLKKINEYYKCFNNDKIYGCIEAKPLNKPLINEDVLNKYIPYLENNNKLDTEGEIIAEVFWYGKVLYTNGLKWNLLFLELSNNKKISKIREEIEIPKWCDSIKEIRPRIKCKPLADFTSDFDNFNGETTEAIENKWDQFITELSKIPWTKEPNEVIEW